MRVAALVNAWPPETFVERHLRQLEARGHEVAAVVPKDAGGHGAAIALLTPTRLPNPRWLVRYRSREPAMLALRLARLATSVEKWCPEVLHFEWNSLAARHIPLMQHLGVPTVVSCRGSQIHVAQHNPSRAEQNARILESLRLASRVHCVADDMRNAVIDLGVKRTRCAVITPAVEPDIAPALHLDGPALRLCAVGSLIPRKGFEYLLLAVAELIRRGVDVTLDLVGGGPEARRLEATVRDLRLAGQVRLLGKRTSHEVFEILSQANCFVLPSLAEGIANVALEAMSAGLPVVSTDCNGMREAVVDGETGFLVPPADELALANALERLVAPGLRLRLGGAGRDRVRAYFTLDQQAEKFERLYAEAVRDGA